MPPMFTMKSPAEAFEATLREPTRSNKTGNVFVVRPLSLQSHCTRRR